MVSASCLCGSTDQSSDDILLDEATDLPVCDYDTNATPLYKAMEQHQWGGVSKFLKTGVWPGNFFADSVPPAKQARTWIHRYEDCLNEIREDELGVRVIDTTPNTNTNYKVGTGDSARRLRWRQLPLHASLIFMAPPSVVKQLIHAFPYALRCPDDKGMLPIHLAFRQAVPDDILTTLLRLFPNGMHVRDKKGRLPLECVRAMPEIDANTTTPQTARGMIIQSIMQQTQQQATQHQHATMAQFQSDIQSLQSQLKTLELSLHKMDQREKETREELMATLHELDTLKRDHKELQHRTREQRSVEEQTLSFQQRIMEQLDMQNKHSNKTRDMTNRDNHMHHQNRDLDRAPTTASRRNRRGRSHSRSRRGRSQSRGSSRRRRQDTEQREEEREFSDTPRDPQRPISPLQQAMSKIFRSQNQESQPPSFSQTEYDDNTNSTSSVESFTDFTRRSTLGQLPYAYTTTTAAPSLRSRGDTFGTMEGETDEDVAGALAFGNRRRSSHVGSSSRQQPPIQQAVYDQLRSSHGQSPSSRMTTPIKNVRTYSKEGEFTPSLLDRRSASRSGRPLARAIYPVQTSHHRHSSLKERDSRAKLTDDSFLRQQQQSKNANENGSPTAAAPFCAGVDSPHSMQWNFSLPSPAGFLKPMTVQQK